jgi:hypothetical protein
MSKKSKDPWWLAVLAAILGAAEGGWGITLHVISILVILIGGAVLIVHANR